MPNINQDGRYIKIPESFECTNTDDKTTKFLNVRPTLSARSGGEPKINLCPI